MILKFQFCRWKYSLQEFQLLLYHGVWLTHDLKVHRIWKHEHIIVNSLVPGKCDNNFKSVISLHLNKEIEWGQQDFKYEVA